MLHVLVVDDSAVVRQAMRTVLAQEPDIQVSVAADPIIAMRKMSHARPDVLLLDVELPRMNGLAFLRQIMEVDPLPVVICSSRVGPGTDVALEALRLGAVEIVAKPRLDVREFLLLVPSLRAAAGARLARRTPVAAPVVALPVSRAPRLVAMGASTGGTEALRVILGAMPADGPAFVIVQHMPAGFTAAFARQLGRSCRLLVAEARDGDAVEPGCALIAPGGLHTRVLRSAAGYYVSVGDGPLVSRHRPSVDELFRSVAAAAGADAVGVLLTGMGDDGASGLCEMRRAGAATVAQDEASCVVFGMPRAAALRGAVDELTPLPEIPQAILQRNVRPLAAHK
jgi:two-component system chemotaxis response regulator CheB